MASITLSGNHNGGGEIVNRLTPDVVEIYGPEWTFVDPKGDRAERLAEVFRCRFPWTCPRPMQTTAQEAVAFTEDGDAQVLALDDLGDTRETLEARRSARRATFQILGKGPGNSGPRLGLQGTLDTGDKETERNLFPFLRTMESISREASGRALANSDPLTGYVLKPLRQVVSLQTVRHLAEKDRDPRDLTGGPLSVTFGTTLNPLVPVRGQPNEKWSGVKAVALEQAGESRGAFAGRVVFVAVVIPEEQTIYFVKVVRTRQDKRIIDGVTPFAPPPQPAPAVFTD